MQLLNKDSKDLLLSQPPVSLAISLQDKKKPLTKLSILWMQEFDGERYHLVARWIKEAEI
ncbi:hypothetical protein WKK05_15010 [Nostoc sp. UHCC 0302]|uniref:hypothetical protein n=1 Tax=Nostoc sp. UHCC 0302 TaxID=3134896 RepID=UPI00311CD086